MKKLLSILAIGLTLSFGMSTLAGAAEGDAKTAQQSKMGTCNKNAGDKKGDDRKAFMKECLSAKPAAAAASPACEKSAMDKKLAGAAKNSHMKKCMADEKGDAKPAAAAEAKPAAKAEVKPAAAKAAEPIKK